MSYIVRVELNSNNMFDFNVLHQSMKNNMFLHTIKSENGYEYFLPKAMYSTSFYSDASRVLESVKQAVATTGKTAEIIVVNSNGCTWSGLKLVK